jgi:hypothetical protein
MRMVNILILKLKHVRGFSFFLGVLFILFFPIPFWKELIFHKNLIQYIVYFPILVILILWSRRYNIPTIPKSFLFLSFYFFWGFYFYFEIFFQTRINLTLILYGLETFHFLKSDIVEIFSSIPLGMYLHWLIFPIFSILLDSFSNRLTIIKFWQFAILMLISFLIVYLSHSYSEMNEIKYSKLDSIRPNISKTEDKSKIKSDSNPNIKLSSDTDVFIFLLEGVGHKYWDQDNSLRDSNNPEGNANTSPRKSLSKLSNRFPQTISIDNCYITTPHSSKSIFTFLTGDLQLNSTRPIMKKINIQNSLPKFFESLGYKTFFIFSQPFYMEGIDGIANSLFQEQIDSKGLEKWANQNSFDLDRFDWGVDDYILSKYLKNEILNQKSPIFAFIGFSNTHSPYFISKNNPDYGKKLTAHERYKSSIQETSKIIREILNLIREKRQNEPLILILSDHGESFGENGFWRHNYSVYNQETKIPCEISHTKFDKIKSIPLAGLPDFSKSIQTLFSNPNYLKDNKNIFSKDYELDIPLKTWSVETYIGYIIQNDKYIFSKEANLLYKMDLLEQNKVIIESRQAKENFFKKWKSYE